MLLQTVSVHPLCMAAMSYVSWTIVKRSAGQRRQERGSDRPDGIEVTPLQCFRRRDAFQRPLLPRLQEYYRQIYGEIGEHRRRDINERGLPGRNRHRKQMTGETGSQ